jgi:hypothetical protein
MKCSGLLARVLALCAVGSLAFAQQPQQRITPNFKDADITMIAEAVSAATARTSSSSRACARR